MEIHVNICTSQSNKSLKKSPYITKQVTSAAQVKTSTVQDMPK